MNDASVGDAKNWRSGKGHRDENFPVASWLIAPRHRGPIMAFYNFVRTADDIADHATLPAIAAIYMAFTLDSAYQHARGRGGMWKGRAQANISESNVSESNVSELR